MLSAPRYLLGVADLALLAAFAWLAASQLRRRFLPNFQGAPAHLATLVLALALLLWVAELLGTFGLFEPLPYLLAVAIVGVGTRTLFRGWCRGGADSAARRLRRAGLRPWTRIVPLPGAARRARRVPHPGDRTRGRAVDVATLISLAIAAAAVTHFVLGVKTKLGTGMTGFDSTWYHAPLAASFFQSGDTWSLHFLAPQYLAWFYPANAETFHAIGMLAFHRDLLSPLLNLGWLLACLLALWCIGRPFGAAPWSLALGAIALSLPALGDQAGEARNDLCAIFFLLAAAAIAVNAWRVPTGPQGRQRDETSGGADGAVGGRGLPTGALVVAGLAAGLAGGTKLTILLPAVVLVVGLALIAPSGARWRALAVGGLAALAGGGYWYLRNLAHTGNPFPWARHLGPISLPGPAQPLGGRESHSVLSYLTDASVWSHWFLPGLHAGLTIFWPLVGALALAGLLLALGPRSSPLLRVLAAAGLAAGIAWLLAPTGAEGPPGAPRGFASGLRFLTPALVLGLALLPVTPPLRDRLRQWRLGTAAGGGSDVEVVNEDDAGSGAGSMQSGVVSGAGHAPHKAVPRNRLGVSAVVALALLAAIALGYPVERHYLRNRYAHPEFASPSLDAAFEWAQSIHDARIATTGTRQYPLFGRDLSNRVQFVGIDRPHGGFVAPTTCRQWRRALDAGRYDYVVATLDRISPGGPAYPPQARWTEAPGARVVLKKPGTVVFQLTTPLDPSACP